MGNILCPVVNTRARSMLVTLQQYGTVSYPLLSYILLRLIWETKRSWCCTSFYFIFELLIYLFFFCFKKNLVATIIFIIFRYLYSFKLCENDLGKNFGKLIFRTLLDASSCLSVLDLSENNVSMHIFLFKIQLSCNEPINSMTFQELCRWQDGSPILIEDLWLAFQHILWLASPCHHCVYSIWGIKRLYCTRMISMPIESTYCMSYRKVGCIVEIR